MGSVKPFRRIMSIQYKGGVGEALLILSIYDERSTGGEMAAQEDVDINGAVVM